MRLATILRDEGTESRDDGTEPVLVDGRGVLRVSRITGDFPTETMALLEESVWARLARAGREAPDSAFEARESVRFTAPYRRPRKIWGIGLNYADHAADLAESAPEQPASFIKADHTIAGPEHPILIPRQSERTTAEAELGLIIGRECRNVDEAHALEFVWGVTTILDQTAEDILRLNPRFLTRCKNFETFLVFGPELVPMESVRQRFDSLADIEVSTIVRRGQEEQRRTNVVANMTHSPASLVAFHSQMMPLFPGDIISTGTPPGVGLGMTPPRYLKAGDVVELGIEGLGTQRQTCVDDD